MHRQEDDSEMEERRRSQATQANKMEAAQEEYMINQCKGRFNMKGFMFMLIDWK